MFQEAALFPWLTVAGNVELALRLRGVPKAAAPAAGRRSCSSVVHLGDFGDKRPHELSGGMRQRVALARALAQDADVLLMDEPFGALDAMTRDLLHDELERIWTERRLTVLFVTHNVREAVRLGDRVVLLPAGPAGSVERVPASTSPAPAHRLPRGRDLAAEITDELARGGRAGMAVMTSRRRHRHGPRRRARSSGLDALRARRPRERPGRRARLRADLVATWPKLAAIAIALGVWQLVVLVGLEARRTSCPAPADGPRASSRRRSAHADVLDGARHHDAAGASSASPSRVADRRRDRRRGRRGSGAARRRSAR